MKKIKTPLSLLLVLCMVMSFGGITVFAEGTVIEGDITVEGSGFVTGLFVSSMDDGSADISETGKSIIAENAGTVTVTGGISASSTGGDPPIGVGVGVNYANAEITVGRDVYANASGNDGNAVGIQINNAMGEYNAAVTVNGNVTANAESMGRGVEAQTNNGGAKAEVTINGNVTASGGNETEGIFAIGDGVTITVNGGDVTATATGGEVTGVLANGGSTVSVEAGEGGQGGNVGGSTTGVDAFGYGTSVEVSGNVIGGNTGVKAGYGSEVTVGGDVTSTNGTGVDASDGSEVMVERSISANNTGVIAGSSSVVTVSGNVAGTSDTGVSAFGGSKVTVGTTDEAGSFTGSKVTGGNHGISAIGESTTVNAGDVSSNPSEFGTGIWAGDSASVTAGDVTTTGIGVKSEGGSSVTAGDVEAGSTGISAENSTVTAGNVTATGETAIAVSVTGSTVEVKNVTGSMGGIVATGDSEVQAGNVEGDSGIMANGSTVTAESVTATDGVGVLAEDGSTVTVGTTDESGIFTAGDVKSEDGIGIKAEGGSNVTAGNVTGATVGVKVEGAATVTIDGTLTVTGGTPILLGDAVTETDAGNINITVWEIQGQAADGNVVSGGQEGAAAALQQNIDYVVKIASGSEAVFADNPGTMKAGEQQIKVSVPEGFTLASAYATNGDEVEITKGEDGNYYATIPVCGGIYLHATLDKIPEPEPQPEPDPKPQPEPEPQPELQPEPVITVSYADKKVTFDLNGGTLNGEAGTLTRWFFDGQTIKLPDAPTKEGFTFAGWETKVRGEKVVLQPGEKFTITGNQSFTALWTEA